jgi:transposase-like protein
MTKLQSPLTALERPRCPRCQIRMPLVAAEREPDGSDNRTFKCEKCGESRTVKAPDPMKSNSAGWLAGELKPPV